LDCDAVSHGVGRASSIPHPYSDPHTGEPARGHPDCERQPIPDVYPQPSHADQHVDADAYPDCFGHTDRYGYRNAYTQ
jgi:hypothetical protein